MNFEEFAWLLSIKSQASYRKLCHFEALRLHLLSAYWGHLYGESGGASGVKFLLERLDLSASYVNVSGVEFCDFAGANQPVQSRIDGVDGLLVVHFNESKGFFFHCCLAF